MLTSFLFTALIMSPANLAQGNQVTAEVVAGNTSFACDLYGKLRAQPGNLDSLERYALGAFPLVLAALLLGPATIQAQVPADQLAKLADLRDRQVISPAEFEREKAKVLA